MAEQQKGERIIIVGCRNKQGFDLFEFPKALDAEKHVLGQVVDHNADNEDRWFFSERAVQGMLTVQAKMNKGRVQKLDEPCNTISSHLAKVSLNSTDPVLFVNERYRRLTPRECARIQSLPDEFNLSSVSEARQYKAIGNAVPPVFMWRIARSLQRVVRANQINQEQRK